MPTLNSDGSASDTQTQLTAASTGDTVLLPSSGSYTWSAAVAMSGTKGVTLDLNGRTVTISGASGVFTINSTSSGSTVNRITNGNIVRGSGYNPFNGPFVIGDTQSGSGVRVDNITFTGSDVLINGNGQGIGLIDHCSFPSIEVAQETMHWYGPSFNGWTTDTGDALAGAANIFTIEDCTFSGAQGNSSCCFQSYYGARIRARHNVAEGAMLEVHGTPGSEGVRWWEFYDNDLTDLVLCIRAGSGVIYNNTGTGNTVLAMQEEDSGYPADYQVGRGINQTLDPAYYWSNTGFTVYLNSNNTCAVGVANMVQLNRDVYNSARPSYVEYTYPHPLQDGGGGGTPGTGGHGRGHKRGILRRM